MRKTDAPAQQGERLGYRQRLHNPGEFERVYAAKSTLRGKCVVLFFCANGVDIARLGVSVSSRHGNAVRRNRIKRVFRAAFRTSQQALPPGYDYVLVPRHGVETYTSAAVREELLDFALKMKKKTM